jgi:hypothetical protein
MSQQLLFGTLIGICAVGILTQAIIIMRSNRRTNKWKGRQVIAIVTNINTEAEAFIGRSAWYITAEWLDNRTGLTYTFRSRPLTSPPEKHVGDIVTVFFDPNHPKLYRIKL